MTTLVAYEKDSDSENDENDYPDDRTPKDDNSSSITLEASEYELPVIQLNTDGASTGLLRKLPQSKINKMNLVEEDKEDELLMKKEQGILKPCKRIKIAIPALESGNDEDEFTASSKRRGTVSGLLALLPPPKIKPKSNTCFIPNIIQKSRYATTIEAHEEKLANQVNPEDMHFKQDLASSYTNFEFHDSTGQHQAHHIGTSSGLLIDQNSSIIYCKHDNKIDLAPAVVKPYTGLDNQAFRELFGTKKKVQNIKMISLQQDEVKSDSTEWLKTLTDPSFEPKALIDPVNNTCKIKNHITALAQRALENDKELQMKWAESRYSRTQTRAKYGF